MNIELPPPIGWARKQPLLEYSPVWVGFSMKPADENGHPPVALYSEDQMRHALKRTAMPATPPSPAPGGQPKTSPVPKNDSP